MNSRKLAIISMSGGLDSATLCAEALYQSFDVFILNFNYNQKNIVETIAFEKLLNYFQKNYVSNGKIIGYKKINLKPLFNEFLDIWAQMRDKGKIKKDAKHQFYTPARNLLFSVISSVIGEIIALANDYNEVNIGLGIHEHSKEAYGEHKDYWDITPEFAKRLSNLLTLNDVKTIKLFTPFVNKTKAEIVKRVLELKIPYKLTWTCYDPQKKGLDIYIPCGKCEACIERELAGKEAGVDDINQYSIKIYD